MEKRKVYFCDGIACDDDKKTVCYLQGGSCHHTPKPEHAISKMDPNFPPTRFTPFEKILLIEEFDEEAIFKKLGEGGGMVISNKVKQLI